MELVRYWQILRRWWWLLAFGITLAGGTSFVISTLTAPTYRSTLRLLVNQQQNPGAAGIQDLLTSERLAKTYSELLPSRPVVDETIKQLNLPLTTATLQKRINVKVIRDTQLLELSVDDTDPVRAAVITNGLAQVFIDRLDSAQSGQQLLVLQQVDKEITDIRQKIADSTARLGQVRATPTSDVGANQQAQGELSQYQDTYLKLLETQQRMAIAQAQSNTNVSVAEPAILATKTGPRRTQNTLLFGFIGLLLSSGLALLITYLDDRVHDPEEVRKIFNVPALATIRFVKPSRNASPQFPLLMDTAMVKGDQLTEAMRLLRTNVGFLTMGGPSVLCISSATPGEGKSTITTNLAIAHAQAGKRVAIIDCDLRKPGIHTIFGLSNEQGLSTYLAQTTKSTEPMFQRGPLDIEVLTAGPVPPNPTELLGAQRMADLIATLRQRVDVVLLDSAPILHLADTLVIQPYTDGTILVINVQHTGTKVLRRIFTSLEQASGRVLGVVLNKDRGRVGTYGYGYSDGYGYGYGYGYGQRSRKDQGTFRDSDGALSPVVATSEPQPKGPSSLVAARHDD